MITTFIMLQNISISDKCCSSELFIHQRQLKTTLFCCFPHNNIIIIIAINVFEQHITLSSEGHVTENTESSYIE